MKRTILDITTSVDGFIAGPDITMQHPLGIGGLALHDWLFKDKTEVDSLLLETLVENSGAVILGARTYLTAIDAWGGVTPFKVPAFIISREDIEVVNGFMVITDGIKNALTQAKEIAGERDVWIMGGANTAQHYLKAGLIDELHIHIAPILLTEGTRLFENLGKDTIELDRFQVIETPAATHLKFHVRR